MSYDEQQKADKADAEEAALDREVKHSQGITKTGLNIGSGAFTSTSLSFVLFKSLTGTENPY